MSLFLILPLSLLIVFFIALFVGIVKKNKRLWITSLIFLIITVLLFVVLLTFNTPVTVKHNGTKTVLKL